MTQDIKPAAPSDPRLDEYEKLAEQYGQLVEAKMPDNDRAALHAALDERTAAIHLANAAREAIPALIGRVRKFEKHAVEQHAAADRYADRATAAEARVRELETIMGHLLDHPSNTPTRERARAALGRQS